MKFPQTNSFLNSLAFRLAAVFVVIATFAMVGTAQFRTFKKLSTLSSPVPEAVSLNIEQCANGPLSAPINCNVATGNEGYGRGNLVSSKSHYFEGDFVPIRIISEDLTVGQSYTITVGYDFTKGGKYATDYLGSYDATESVNNDPCVGVTGCDNFTTFPVPVDPQVTAGFDGVLGTGDDIVQIPGVFTCFGCTITAVSGYTLDGSVTGDSTKQLTITFTANEPNVVIAYGSHISTRADWGLNNSAINISGSPYHNFIVATSIPANQGNRDLQLSAEAVIFPARVTIVKRVINLDGTFSSTFIFGFSNTDMRFDADGSFTLVDSDPTSLGGGSVSKFPIVNFGAANSITITESQILNNRYSLTGLACVEAPGGIPAVLNTTVDPGTRTATIIPDEGEMITCTFTNSENVITAAPASVSGRVLNADGLPIAKAKVFVTDVATNSTYSTDTNRNGEYVIDGLETGQFYFITVAVRGYTFADGTRTFTLNDNLTGVDFVANP